MSTDLAEIEAALKAATPGPWRWRNTQDPMLMGDGSRYLVMSFERMGMRGAQPLFRDERNIMQPALGANINDFSDAHLIANAPAWLAELLERVKAAEAEVERLQSELQDFAEYGARHDTTPTICGDPDAIWWYGYIQSMDRGVRERARRALATTDDAERAQTGADAPSDERNRFSDENVDGVQSARWDRPEVALIRHMGGRVYARVGAHKWTELPKFGQVIVTEDLVAQQHEEIAVFTSPRTSQRYEPPADDHESGCCR